MRGIHSNEVEWNHKCACVENAISSKWSEQNRKFCMNLLSRAVPERQVRWGSKWEKPNKQANHTGDKETWGMNQSDSATWRVRRVRVGPANHRGGILCLCPILQIFFKCSQRHQVKIQIAAKEKKKMLWIVFLAVVPSSGKQTNYFTQLNICISA